MPPTVDSFCSPASSVHLLMSPETADFDVSDWIEEGERETGRSGMNQFNGIETRKK